MASVEKRSGIRTKNKCAQNKEQAEGGNSSIPQNFGELRPFRLRRAS